MAAIAALRALGVRPDVPEEEAISPDPLLRDVERERLAWVRAMTLKSAATPFLCQCEEVTAADVLELKPTPLSALAAAGVRSRAAWPEWTRRVRHILMW